MNETIMWWKVLLLCAVSLLFLWLLVELSPMVFLTFCSFAYEVAGRGLLTVALYSDHASLFHVYLCNVFLAASTI